MVRLYVVDLLDYKMVVQLKNMFNVYLYIAKGG